MANRQSLKAIVQVEVEASQPALPALVSLYLTRGPKKHLTQYVTIL